MTVGSVGTMFPGRVMSRKYEEYVGVKLPGQGRTIVKILIGVMDTEEEILQRISKRVGTVFRFTGIDYEVVNSDPFELKKLGDEAPFRRRGADDEDFEAPDESGEHAINLPPEEEAAPDSTKRVVAGPQVGERWRPRDPRRKASFTVLAIEGEHAVTDDGRKVQLARFKRYERVPA